MLSSVTVVLSSAVWFSFINSLSETPVTFFITWELHHSVGHYRGPGRRSDRGESMSVRIARNRGCGWVETGAERVRTLEKLAWGGLTVGLGG